MGATHVALLRGINVGKAKRVAMADLRALVEGLGYGDVRTLLNSGNVVFSARGAAAKQAAARIEKAIATELGVSCRVTVLAAEDVHAILAADPLGTIATNPSRYMVTVLTDPAKDRPRLEALAKEDWSPEVLALGPRAAYTWCPEGVLDSQVFTAIAKLLGDGQTTRNWNTMVKLREMLVD